MMSVNGFALACNPSIAYCILITRLAVSLQKLVMHTITAESVCTSFGSTLSANPFAAVCKVAASFVGHGSCHAAREADMPLTETLQDMVKRILPLCHDSIASSDVWAESTNCSTRQQHMSKQHRL